MGTPIQNIEDRDKILWFVVIAYKQEAKAEKILSGTDGLEFYIAKHYVIRTVQGKRQRMLVPYIPNLLFIHASWTQIVNFKKTHPFIKFATWKKSTGTEYLIVPDAQMQNFIRVTSDNEKDVRYYKPEEINFGEGTKVRVIGGELDGVEGTFIKVRGRRSRQLVVVLPKLLAASIQISPDYLEILK